MDLGFPAHTSSLSGLVGLRNAEGARYMELLSFTGEALAVSSSMPHLPLPAKARGGGGGGARDVRWPRAALV